MNKFFRREEIAERAKKAILVAIVLSLILSMTLFGTSCFLFSDSDSDTDTEEDEEGGGATTEPVDDHVGHIGDVLITGDTRVRVNRVYETTKIGLEETDYVFLVIEARVENLSTREKFYTSSNFYLRNGKLTYEAHSSGIYLENGFWASLTLGPGLSATTLFVYEIPRSYIYGDYYFEVDDGFLSEAVKIYLLDKNDNQSGTTTETPDEDRYHIGDTVKTKEMQMVIDSIYETKKIGSETTDHLFLVIQTTITNIGSEERTFTAENFRLYNGTRKYEVSDAGLYVDDGFWLLVKLGSGFEEKVVFVFEIPSSYINGDYYFEFGDREQGDVAKIYLTEK